jgi:hypothetical protein
MNYAALKTHLKALINRSDMTDTDAATFIQMAQDRLERWPQIEPLKYAPRPSFMEKYVDFTIAYDVASLGAFVVPNNFLQIISLHSTYGELKRVGLSDFLKLPETTGVPTVYMQVGHSIRMRPIPATTEKLYMMYFGTDTVLSLDTDSNYWTISAVDAMAYAAAIYACEHFEDERVSQFTDRFNRSLMELQDQTINESLSGSMSMGAAYSYPDDIV